MEKKMHGGAHTGPQRVSKTRKVDDLDSIIRQAVVNRRAIHKLTAIVRVLGNRRFALLHPAHCCHMLVINPECTTVYYVTVSCVACLASSPSR